MIHPFKNAAGDKTGFTLIELLIVITIFSIMSLVVIPRITTVTDSRRSNFLVLTTMIAKTFDDAFVNDRMNFVLLHLYEPVVDKDIQDEVFTRTNGISVVTQNEDGKFVDNADKILQYKSFPDSFRIEEVILSTGEKITSGNALIPFYPSGQSDNVIIHVLVNNEQNWSIRIYKMRKEPEIFNGYVGFSEQ
jgi:prepilin-type N-terminal cleavage/methylation domain-containing protein